MSNIEEELRCVREAAVVMRTTAEELLKYTEPEVLEAQPLLALAAIARCIHDTTVAITTLGMFPQGDE